MGCGGSKAEVEANSNSPNRGLPPKAEAQVEAVVVEEIEEAAEAAKKAAEEKISPFDLMRFRFFTAVAPADLCRRGVIAT